MSTPKRRLRRSAHFIPGPNEKMLGKALDSAADMLILDLEDAVPPSSKREARKEIASWLGEVDFGSKEVAVRINPLETPWGIGDVYSILEYEPDFLMVPKAERLSALQALVSLVAEVERERSWSHHRVRLLPICSETPLGFSQIQGIASEPRVQALTWGTEDLSASMGATATRTNDGQYLEVYERARSETLIAAASNHLTPIDSVFVELGNISALIEECKLAAQMGFLGKLTIHPEQIDIVNEAFTPTAEEIDRARLMVEAFAEAQANGDNALRFEGQMVDAPHLSRAKALLSRIVETEEE